VPFIIELGKVPTRQQEQILWYLIDMLPRFNGGAMDATGPGQTLAEYTGDKYGEAIHQIVLNRKWYAEFMPKMVGAFEDGSLLLPKDKSTSDDFRAVEIIDGIPMVPQVDKRDIKDPEMFRHGDAAIAGALFWYASLWLSPRAQEPPT
jgi:phage FluMu gp28-like protein